MAESERRAKPSGLPSFGAPPLNEVVCGVTFGPLTSIRASHFGAFWALVRDRYPNTEDAPPIVTEEHEVAALQSAAGPPLPRVWFVNGADTRLIQFQSNRLYVNWRARDKEPKYPRFPEILSDFQWAYGKLIEFVGQERVGTIALESYDLTYVNRIPVPSGEGITSFTARVFKDFVWENGRSRFLPPPLEIGWSSRFALPGKGARLSVRLGPTTVKVENQQVLLLELSVKGPTTSSEVGHAAERLNMARTWIVNGFVDLTRDEVQRDLWKRES